MRKRSFAFIVLTAAAVIVMSVAAAGPQSGAKPTLKRGLVAYWSCDEGAGATVYDPIAGNNGTISGATFDTPGPARTSTHSLHFDGDDYVAVPDAPSLDLAGPMTISFWVKPESPAYGVSQTIITKNSVTWYGTTNYQLAWDNVVGGDGTPGNGGAWFFDSGQNCLYGKGATTGSNLFPGAPNLTIGAWNHLAVTYDGTILSLYHNGIKIGECNLVSDVGGLLPNDAPLYFGKLVHPGPCYYPDSFTGNIDEVRFYSRCLTPREIGRLAGGR